MLACLLTLGVEVDELGGLSLSEVSLGLLLVGSESVVVLLDDRVEQRLEQSVRLGVRSIETDARVEVGNTSN